MGQVVFAVFLGFLGLLGSDLYLPAMPMLMDIMQTSANLIEFSITIYLIGFVLSPVAYGLLADRFGRRPTITLGLSIASLGALIALLSTHITPFLIGRLLQGLGAGVTLPLFRTLIRDLIAGRQMARVSSYASMLLNLSPVLGMVIGSYLVHYLSWQWCFVIIISSYVAYLIVMWLLCKETLHQSVHINVDNLKRNIMILFADRTFMCVSVLSGLGMSISFAYVTAGAIIFKHQFHISTVTYGWQGLAICAAVILGKLTNAQLLKHYRIATMIVIGFGLVALSGITLSIWYQTTSAVVALGLICIACFGSAFIMSNCMSIALVKHQSMTAFAAAVYGSFQSLICFCCSMLLAYFAHYLLLSMGGLFLGIAITAGCVIMVLYQQNNGYFNASHDTSTTR